MSGNVCYREQTQRGYAKTAGFPNLELRSGEEYGTRRQANSAVLTMQLLNPFWEIISTRSVLPDRCQADYLAAMLFLLMTFMHYSAIRPPLFLNSIDVECLDRFIQILPRLVSA